MFFRQYESPTADDLRDKLKEAALAVGVRPAAVYATWKTGLIPTEGRLDRFTELELDEFEAAAEEYDELVGRGIDPYEEGPTFTKRQKQKFSELTWLVSKSPVILASIIDRGSANA